MKTIALHRTFDKGADGKRQLVFYVSDGKQTQRIIEKKFEAFISKLPTSVVIRATAVNASDEVLLSLADRGHKIRYAYWHDTGMAKGLEPEAIVEQYALADDEIFRDFVARRDIADLKTVLAARNAIVQYAGDAARRLRQVGRNIGKADMETTEMAIAEIKKASVLEEGTPLDKSIENRAKKIRECVLFNEVAGIKGSWIMAASVIAYAGGFERFPNVASLWHYFGQHVGEDGRMPRRKKGVNVDWSPKGRTVLYQLTSSLIKNRNNPWRAVYEEHRAYEIAEHDRKHPGCAHKDGHCTAMACRKVAKEILKQVYLLSLNIPYEENHNPIREKAIA